MKNGRTKKLFVLLMGKTRDGEVAEVMRTVDRGRKSKMEGTMTGN